MASRLAGKTCTRPRTTVLARLVPLLVLAAAFSSLVGSARAQFTGDPFDPYRNSYRSSSVPAYSNIGPLSNSYRLAPSPGVGFTTGLGDIGPEVGFLSGLNTSLMPPRSADLTPADPFGLPSTLGSPSNRPNTPGYDRTYRPNANVDSKYYEQVRARDQLYFKALEESDPAKRAQLLKQFQEAGRRANLQLSASSRQRRGTDTLQSAARATRPTSPRQPGAPPDPTQPLGTPSDNSEMITTYNGMLSWSRVLDRMVVQDLKTAAKP